MIKSTIAHPHPDANDIEAIHAGTALYTSPPEVEALLDKLNWPDCGGNLLDPGCGNGNMIIAALSRLNLDPEDKADHTRVKGFEFHAPSVKESRQRIEELLISKGWEKRDAVLLANEMVEERDYLLNKPDKKWDIVLSNPPYWRRFRLPEAYKDAMDQKIAEHARGDLLHAYLHNILTCVKSSGRLALITSDRWLSNNGASGIREEIGRSFKVSHAERLTSKSPFHRPKERKKGSPPRVHAVSLILSDIGRKITRDPFLIEEMPEVNGIPFCDLADIRLAPWLGPDGIFIIDDPNNLPEATLVPCIMPKGIHSETDEVLPTTRWAIVTGDKPPHPSVIKHLNGSMDKMPARGIRSVPWHPPERFDKHLPLKTNAILIPRIAKKLRAITIPGGHLPINHSLVVASGLPATTIREMLEHHLVQQQADILAPRIEGGYRSYTATLLRQLIIPYEAIPADLAKAA